jgi:hypothetical protein
MNYELAFWVATVVATLLLLAFIWATKKALKTQYYNRNLFVEVMTSHKVRDEALAELNDFKNGVRK